MPGIDRKRRRVRTVTAQLGFSWQRGSTSLKPCGEPTYQVLSRLNYRPYYVVEECVDVNHEYQRRLKKLLKQLKIPDNRVDYGGPLDISKATYRVNPHFADQRYGTAITETYCANWAKGGYTGGVRPAGSSWDNTNPSLPSLTNVPIDSIGTTGWDKYSPTSPKGSLSQFLAELRDLPRNPIDMMLKARSLRDVGSSYLNMEFGWRPFLQDVRETLLTYLEFDKRIQQLRRDNGKTVRRKGVIDTTVGTTATTTSGTIGSIIYPAPSAAYTGGVVGTASKLVVSTIKNRSWFSGRFRYYLAPEGTWRYREQINRIIYGLDLTPTLLWELMPWSWLIDWFTTIGSSIQNMVEIAADSLVADYAYGMGHWVSDTTTYCTWDQTLALPGNVWNPACLMTTRSCSGSVTYEVKRRIKASPYGFGLEIANLTDRQKAILLALGLTRL